MQKLVFVNGNGTQIDLTGGNFGITNWAGLSNVPLNIQTQQVPFEDGGVFLDALMEQREIEVTVAIYDGNNLELRYQKKRELISALNPKLGEGTLIYTNDYLSRQIKAVPQIPLFENKNSNDSGTLKASVVFSCCNPYWEDVEDNEVTFDIKQQPIIENKGDVPTKVEIEFITQNATNPRLTNLKTNKFIGYEGQLLGNLELSTNVGKKTVYSKKTKFDDAVSVGVDIMAIVFSNEQKLLVKVGENGVIQTSPDGDIWKLKNSTTSEQLNDIIYSDYFHKFFIVGNGGVILSSSDTENWDLLTSGTSENLNSLVVSEDSHKLVIVGDNGTVLTSTDGINFTAQTSGTNENLLSVTYSEELSLFVAVGMDCIIITSSDGVTWTTQASGYSEYTFGCVIYSTKLHKFITGTSSYLISSIDGINWVLLTQGIVPIQYTYSETLDLFVGVYGYAYYSKDCIHWTEIEFQGNSNVIDVIYSTYLGIFIGVGLRNNQVVSYDGINWLEKINSLHNDIFSIAYSKEKNLFVGVGGSVYLSNNGKDWDYGGSIPWSYTQKSVIYVKQHELFFSVGYFQALNYSEDGLSWTLESLQFSDPYKYAYSIIYSEKLDMLVVVGDDGSIWTTDNNVSFIYLRLRSTQTTKKIYGVCYSEELSLFVAVGEDGVVVTSSDGITWTLQTSGITETLKDVIYLEKYDKFIAIGNNGFIAISYDGVNWLSQTSGVSTNLNKIRFFNFLQSLIIVGDNGLIMISTDSINWILQQAVSPINLNDVEFYEKENRYIIVGDEGLIVNSYDTEKENEIQNLQNGSDMNFDLDVGENQLRLNMNAGFVSCRIKYRQKYIGV